MARRRGTARERVYASLADVDGYARWWPQVRKIHRIDVDAGRVRIRGLLPYTLDLQGWCAALLS